jgi:hypothetical protein
MLWLLVIYGKEVLPVSLSEVRDVLEREDRGDATQKTAGVCVPGQLVCLITEFIRQGNSKEQRAYGLERKACVDPVSRWLFRHPGCRRPMADSGSDAIVQRVAVATLKPSANA